MISRDEQRSQATDRIAMHLLQTGLAQASLRQLAVAAGVSDRMLLYYFSDKSDVLAAAMERVASQLSERLEDAIPEETRLSAARLIAVVAELTTGDEMRPYMRLWIEVVAAAARGEEPFVGIAHTIAAGFLQWIEMRLVLNTPGDVGSRQALAAAVLAVIDGVALLEVCAGAETTQSAARAIGRLLRA